MINKSGTIMLNKLERRIIDISYKLGLSHIGSCLSAVRLIDQIYLVKKPSDIFVLSSGHAALALYVVLEKFEGKNAEELYAKHGTHPNRDLDDKIWVSTGSLGQGLPIAVGMALADKTRDVYVMTTDGEMAEGSCWEALRIASEQRIENLKITVNANGYGAYGKVDADLLDIRMQYFYPSLVIQTNTYSYPDYLQGVDAHYHKLTKEQYEAFT